MGGRTDKDGDTGEDRATDEGGTEDKVEMHRWSGTEREVAAGVKREKEGVREDNERGSEGTEEAGGMDNDGFDESDRDWFKEVDKTVREVGLNVGKEALETGKTVNGWRLDAGREVKWTLERGITVKGVIVMVGVVMVDDKDVKLDDKYVKLDVRGVTSDENDLAAEDPTSNGVIVIEGFACEVDNVAMGAKGVAIDVVAEGSGVVETRFDCNDSLDADSALFGVLPCSVTLSSETSVLVERFLLLKTTNFFFGRLSLVFCCGCFCLTVCTCCSLVLCLEDNSLLIVSRFLDTSNRFIRV